MRSSLLLLLSLMTGCELRSEVKGCRGGWVEFTCKYPKTTGNYKNIGVVGRRGTFIQKEDGCQDEFNQNAYRTSKTTITCDYSGHKHSSSDKFICKENKFTCEEILSTKSSVKSNGTFTLTETNSGFSVSISNVSSHDAGLYWCGVNKGNYRTGLRKIQLKVEDITTFRRSPTIGQNFTYWCAYKNGALIKKFICKGEDPSICQPLVNTEQQKMNNGKFSMKDDKEGNITITVREVTAEDSGTYWCGAKSTDRRRSNTFYHRFLMTAVKTSTSTSPASSTQSTTASGRRNVQTSTSTSPVSSTTSSAQQSMTSTSAERDGGSQVVITVGVCVAVLLLLFVIILILIYKRCSHSKHTRNGAAAQHTREDYIYEEVQERTQRPDSGNTVTTIYATANFPTNPSASLHYSTINFKNSSDKAGGEAVILKPSSSACEYSTVKYSQSPTYSTVNEPSRSPEDPLYSTVNKPMSYHK